MAQYVGGALMAINRELIGQIAFKQEQIFNRESYNFMDVPKVIITGREPNGTSFHFSVLWDVHSFMF